MKEAISIKYGGDFVEAAEANEASYFELGLVCPCCHKSVRWVKTQERTSSLGNAYRVEAFFAHYRAVSIEEALACSERSSNIKKHDSKKIIDKAKRQRNRLFQAWFWDVVEKHVIQSSDGSLSPRYRKALLLGIDIDPTDGEEYIYRFTGLLMPIVRNFAKNVDIVKSGAAVGFKCFSVFADGSPENYELLRDGDARVRSILGLLGGMASQKLHQKVVFESIDFLASDPNLHIVRALFTHFSGFLADIYDIDAAWLVEDIGRSATLFYRVIGFLFSVIPWANEFNSISGKTDLPDLERAFTGTASVHAIELLRISFSLATLYLDQEELEPEEVANLYLTGKQLESEQKANLWDVFNSDLFEDSPIAQGDFSPTSDEHTAKLNDTMQFNSVQTLRSSTASTKKSIGFGNPRISVKNR